MSNSGPANKARRSMFAAALAAGATTSAMARLVSTNSSGSIMAGSLLPQPKQRFLGASWKPLVGGQIFTYAAGTLTPKTTYQNAALTIANSNPAPANADGEVLMFGAGAYRILLKDAFGSTIYDVDNVESSQSIVDTLRQDLDHPSGASMVGYHSSPGRTTEQQLDMLYYGIANILDPQYAGGADPAGVKNSTAAIQAAMDAKKYVIFPAGTYLTGRLVLKFHGQILSGAGRDATVLRCPSGYCITNYDGVDTGPIGADWIGGFKLCDLTLRGGFIHADDFASPANSWATGHGRGKPFATRDLNVGVRLKRAYPFWYENIRIEKFHRGEMIVGGAAGTRMGTEFSDCQYGTFVVNGAEWGDAAWLVTTQRWLSNCWYRNCWIGLGGSDLVQSAIPDRTSCIFEPCNSAVAIINGGDNTWSGYYERCSEGIYRNGGDMGHDVIVDPFFAGAPGAFWGNGDSILMDAGIGASGRITLRDGGGVIKGGGIRVLNGRLLRPEKFRCVNLLIGPAVAHPGGFAAVAVPLVAQEDTDGFFRTGASVSRIIIPNSCRGSRVRLSGSIRIDGNTTFDDLRVDLHKNGATFAGTTKHASITSLGYEVTFSTWPVTVDAGDYFELSVSMKLPRDIPVSNASWIALEVLE